jgi:hypothetical protein
MYRIVIFWHPEVQLGRGRCPSRGAFDPVFRSYRRLPAQHSDGKGMDHGRRDGLHEGLCHRVGGCRAGVSQKRPDFRNAVFTVFRNFGLEDHPEYSVPGLWASRAAQPVFQRYKRLKADWLRFEGEFSRVSGIHLTAEPREGFVRTATAGFREPKCL